MKKIALLLVSFVLFTGAVFSRPSETVLKKLSKLQSKYRDCDIEYNSLCNKYVKSKSEIDHLFGIARGKFLSSNSKNRATGNDLLQKVLKKARDLYSSSGFNGILVRRVNLCESWKKIGREIDNLYKNRKNDLNGKANWEAKAIICLRSATDARYSFGNIYNRKFREVYRNNKTYLN